MRYEAGPYRGKIARAHSVAPNPAISDQELAGLWLATQQFSLVCRHFEFGPLSAAAAPLLNSMAPVGRSVQPNVPEVDVI